MDFDFITFKQILLILFHRSYHQTTAPKKAIDMKFVDGFFNDFWSQIFRSKNKNE